MPTFGPLHAALLAVALVLTGCSAQVGALPISGQLGTTTTTTTTTTVPPPAEMTTQSGHPTQLDNGIAVSSDHSERRTPFRVVILHPEETSTTTSTTTSTIPEAPTLTELVEVHFLPEDRAWAMRVAFCESSATGRDTHSSAVNKSSGASGWYQHLPKFWIERTEAAGIPGASIWDPVAQVRVAAYLFYDTPQGAGHWFPSEHCWKN